ncbi:MAG: hypothetical protein NVSMB38_17230 [Ktedonobacteraceae bacterium]
MDRWSINVEPSYGELSEAEAAAHRPLRARASVWIDPVVQQNISASSIVKERRAIPNPRTPIPARASALPAVRPVKVRPRYPRIHTLPQDSDITRIPTLPQPTMWQYELPDFEAESSLSSLSLAYPEAAVDRAIDEITTLPPPRSRAIDEIATLPPPKQSTLAAQKSSATIARKNANGKMLSLPFSRQQEPQRQKSITLPAPRSLSEIATLPPGAATVATPHVSGEHGRRGLLTGARTTSTIVESTAAKSMKEAASWTTGQGKNSLLAQRIASRANNRKGQRKSSLSLNPIDRVRWWLLYPGRIEFLLWLNGTIVLVAVTCLLLFATVLSTGWISAGLSSIAIGIGSGGIQPATTPGGSSTSASGQTSCTAGNAASPQCYSTKVSASGLQLTLVDSTHLLPGMPIYLYGQGFSANKAVTFTYDTQIPCSPDATQADVSGSFAVSLRLGLSVKAGTHKVVAYDTASKRALAVNVIIAPLPFGKTAPPTSTPLPPGVTPTATKTPGGQGGGLPTPVGQTPVPVTPTVGVTPTSVPTHPPTPTVGVTPSPTVGHTPTVGITPTVGPTKTPTATKHAIPSSALKNALYDEKVDGYLAFSPWLWIAIIGYMLSMTMLGLAGLLYRRNRRILL